jgi:uncharacterized protein YggE
VLFVSVVSFAQESGNRAYNQQRREPMKNSGVLTQGGEQRGAMIEANVLMNLPADGYVAVFGIAQEGSTVEESNAKVDSIITGFKRAAATLGISENDTYVDLITQNKVYEYRQETNAVVEQLKGFESKKTIAVRYKQREQLKAIVDEAAKASIFDLIKVDYVLTDLPAAREKLYEEATKIIKEKEARYKTSFGVKMSPVAVANEKYDAFYPGELYRSYQAYESGDTYGGYNSNSRVIQQRKSSTLYYDPLDPADFDRVMNPLGIEPMIQLTLYLRLEYAINRPTTNP